ncbi:MAG: type IV pilus secretin PilQ [Gammaproteobacteria bacterium]|nr:type IV pilus secretin PilQ [Gammaproteobacteria bacterium]
MSDVQEGNTMMDTTMKNTTNTKGLFASLLQGLLLTCMTIILMSGTAHAQSNSLEQITYTSLPGDRVQVKLTMSQPATKPLSFTIDNPARIALDLAETNSNVPKSQTIGVGIAQSIRAIEAKGRTRVILNLAQLVDYETDIRGNDIIITLGGNGNTGSTAIAASSPSKLPFSGKTSSTSSQGISNIDFRRGERGEGRVIVTLSDPTTKVDIKEEGGQIIVDFFNANLPSNLERRLDVIDFATPVKTVDTYAQGNNIRMVVAASGNYDHLAYQSNNLFTIDVKPMSKEEEEALKKEKFGYTGERLSLNFQDIEVRAVLQLIADFTQLNMVTSDTVSGNLTLRLKNVPWDQALDIILKTKGLAMRQRGNVMLVAPAEEIAAREKVELEAQKQVSELAPLKSEFMQINYAKASEFASLLKAKENSLMTSRGNVSVDERTNTLLVQDTVEKLSEIRKVITKLDIPVRQVLIESRIVIADDDFSKDLGVKFGLSRDDFDGSTTGTGTAVSGSLTAAGDLIDNETLVDPQRLNVNLPVANASGSIGLMATKLPFGWLVDLELTALQTENRGEIVSAPRVITSNQKAALIEAGVEIPYAEASSSGASTISFKKAVLALNVTPQITPDDRISMELDVTKDSQGANTPAGPAINTQQITTNVLVDNGQTIVLGGIYEQTTINTTNRVPFFGDLPVVGVLFRRTEHQDDKSELLVFVTPKILKDSVSLR